MLLIFTAKLLYFKLWVLMLLFLRHIHEPEVIEEFESETEKREPDEEESDEGELSDEEIERRRQLLKQKLMNRKENEVRK